MDNKIKIKSYAKINLFFDVKSRRLDGYHLINSIMQSINIYDVVEVYEISKGITIYCDNPNIPVNEKNICYKAAVLLIEKYNIDKGVCISINKNIPSEAGMAGGSGNAAAVMLSLDKLWKLSLSNEELTELCLKIGADVPFCLHGGTMLAEGIGEKLTAVGKFHWQNIVVVKPELNISTAAVYKSLNPVLYNSYDISLIISAISSGDHLKAASLAANTLEFPVASIHPEINEIKGALANFGAVKSLMTGSGSAVFGLFEDEKSAVNAESELKGLYPYVRRTETIDCGLKEIS